MTALPDRQAAVGRTFDRLASAPLTLIALAVLALGSAAVLAFSPLPGYGDTYCETAFHRFPEGAGSACDDTIADRRLWVYVCLALAAALLGLALRARRSLRRPSVRTAGLLLAAVFLGVACVGFLAVGTDVDHCGSILNKWFADGTYDPGRPAACAPTYDQSAIGAAITGVVALSFFVAAGRVESRGRNPTRVGL